MNKYQEAFNFIATATNGCNGIVKEMNTLKELVERATPKKPSFEGDGYADNGEIDYDTWVCPNCETKYEVDYQEYDYCPNCGQALRWEKE